MQEEKIGDLRERLEEDRASLVHQLSDLGANVAGDRVDLDVDEGFADSAAATAERSEKLSLVDQLKVTYQDVIEALRKLDEGTYGKCERCGRDIAEERLEAIPSARLCVSCKQQVRQG